MKNVVKVSIASAIMTIAASIFFVYRCHRIYYVDKLDIEDFI